MSLPVFYSTTLAQQSVDGMEAQHIARVLRMRVGEHMIVTNGKGVRQEVELTSVTDKKVLYKVLTTEEVATRNYRIHVAIAPTRKADRNEWMMEKIVEMGVEKVSFINTQNTHTESFNRVVNRDRMERIAISAMKQSAQFHLPVIEIGVDFSHLILNATEQARYIAYVPEKATSTHLMLAASGANEVLVVIGPEGDFTPQEVAQALQANFAPVSLGNTRLRTETAAVVACHALHLSQLC